MTYGVRLLGIALLLFVFAGSLCSGGMEAMCSGELGFNQYRIEKNRTPKDRFLREFVLPNGGLYKRTLASNLEGIDPNGECSFNCVNGL